MNMLLFAFLLGLQPVLVQTAAEQPQWSVQTSGIQTNLRGVSASRDLDASSAPIVWASGSNGVILKSEDSGGTWKELRVEGGDALDFRGIQNFDAKMAYVMSSGEGEKSRIYKTTDGGSSWELQYTDKRAGFFLDALVCNATNECFALSDPVDGKFLIVHTADGRHWQDLPRENMPVALPGEGVFAASNTAMTIYGGKEIYFGTGGAKAARVFHSTDLGRTWTVTETPVAIGNASSGIFSIVRAGNTMIAVGGDYRAPDATSSVAAYSRDGGRTWQLAAEQPSGFRSGVARVVGETFFAVGPNGEDISTDGGAHWTRTDALNLNAVAVLDAEHAWAVGAKGTVAKFVAGRDDKR